MKFNIGDKVTSVLNPLFLGQVVSIHKRGSGTDYSVSYFKDGELLTAAMYEYEIELIVDNGKLGFQNE